MGISISQQLLIGEGLKFAAHYVPNRDAFVFGEARLTYGKMLERATHLAGWLQKHGIQKNDKIGCLFKNGTPFVELFFAVSLNGSVFVPVNFRLVSTELEYILNHADIKILFIDEEFADMILSIEDKLSNIEKIVVVGRPSENREITMVSYDSIFEATTSFQQRQDFDDDDPLAIVYTSGTTGKPKGAVLTHKNLYMNGMHKLYHAGAKFGTKHLTIPPLFHIAGLANITQLILMQGTMYIHREFNPKVILETIEKEKINSMFLVPSMWNIVLQEPNLHEYDLSSMRICATAGAICPLELKYKIIETFKNGSIHETFGQTEMSPSTTFLSGDDALDKSKTASVGIPSLNVRIRVVDDAMNDVPVGEIGEIVYQGPTTMKEYFKNPEATKEAFRGGWFHSGDLVRMDEDGFVYVVDRKKDMIISGGENIYPKEIEEVLYTHPDILEAAVVGVPDLKWGESVKACVVPKTGRQLSENEIIQYCQQRLASYKKPRYVEFFDTLPKNAAGKILKTVLRNNVKDKALN